LAGGREMSGSTWAPPLSLVAGGCREGGHWARSPSQGRRVNWFTCHTIISAGEGGRCCCCWCSWRRRRRRFLAKMERDYSGERPLDQLGQGAGRPASKPAGRPLPRGSHVVTETSTGEPIKCSRPLQPLKRPPACTMYFCRRRRRRSSSRRRPSSGGFN